MEEFKSVLDVERGKLELTLMHVLVVAKGFYEACPVKTDNQITSLQASNKI